MEPNGGKAIMSVNKNVKMVIRRVSIEILSLSLAAMGAVLLIRGWNYLHPEQPSSGTEIVSGPSIAIGSELAVPGVEFKGHLMSLVLVTSPQCTYCIASEPFHARLRAEAQRNKIPVYVTVPNTRQAGDYLKKAGLAGLVTSEWRDMSAQAEGTPTIVAVDSSATVRRLWLGRLPSNEETSLLALVNAPNGLYSTDREIHGRIVNYYSRTAIEQSLASLDLIDVRERDRPAIGVGAKTDVTKMPLLELATRAPLELNHAHAQVIDCSVIPLTECSRAIEGLQRIGFRVATLGAGAFYSNCQVHKSPT